MTMPRILLFFIFIIIVLFVVLGTFFSVTDKTYNHVHSEGNSNYNLN